MTVSYPVQVAVLTVSDTRTLDTDKSGARVVSALQQAGHRLVARELVTDDTLAIRAVLERWIGDGEVEVVLVTGGTGFKERDVTPEALAPLITRPIPGFGELFRWLSYAEIGTSTVQSRCEGAECSGTFVFLLPGSPGAVATAMDKILLEQLDSEHRPCNFAELLPRIRKLREGRAQ